ncbi:hypothetical protein LOK49_LG08G00242 [Camellia lanceoleosa]|uniref:Uncharacterized protein n=1 Tax=Camellia lanceoleosa TaxID=1840588 RepID=A0ACC0GN60_9ERIC|nr:hypothetical protein LOK49_LG08G00242 [Camellia lanceoleosa]
MVSRVGLKANWRGVGHGVVGGEKLENGQNVDHSMLGSVREWGYCRSSVSVVLNGVGQWRRRRAAACSGVQQRQHLSQSLISLSLSCAHSVSIASLSLTQWRRASGWHRATASRGSGNSIPLHRHHLQVLLPVYPWAFSFDPDKWNDIS